MRKYSAEVTNTTSPNEPIMNSPSCEDVRATSGYGATAIYWVAYPPDGSAVDEDGRATGGEGA